MAEPYDDREAVDRAFAELVAGYHLTAERPAAPRFRAELTGGDHRTTELSPGELTPTEPAPTQLTPPELTPTELTAGDVAPSDEPPDEPPGRPEMVVLPLRFDPVGPRLPRPPELVDAPPADERYVPDPLPPLSRPGAPALVGWTGVLFAALVVLAAGFGAALPSWLGWLAVSSFIVGSVVLLTQLPRHRPPDAGDGAVL